MVIDFLGVSLGLFWGSVLFEESIDVGLCFRERDLSLDVKCGERGSDCGFTGCQDEPEYPREIFRQNALQVRCGRHQGIALKFRNIAADVPQERVDQDLDGCYSFGEQRLDVSLYGFE